MLLIAGLVASSLALPEVCVWLCGWIVSSEDNRMPSQSSHTSANRPSAAPQD